MEFPKEYPKCSDCGCEETVCREACKDESSVAKGKFVSMEQKLIPIQDFLKISTPTTNVLLCHWDICSECGRYRCTRIEKTSMPTDALMRMLGMVPHVIARK